MGFISTESTIAFDAVLAFLKLLSRQNETTPRIPKRNPIIIRITPIFLISHFVKMNNYLWLFYGF